MGVSQTDGKWFIHLKHIKVKPNRSWSAEVPAHDVKALANVHDVLNKAFNSTDAKQLSLLPIGNPDLSKGVAHFDAEVVIAPAAATIAPIKFRLVFKRDDYETSNGEFQSRVLEGRRWQRVGTIDQFDDLLKEYPPTDYEWGGTYNHVIPMPLFINTWNKGHRVGFVHPYPMGDSANKFFFWVHQFGRAA